MLVPFLSACGAVGRADLPVSLEFLERREKKVETDVQASVRASACLCLHIRADYQAHRSRAEDSSARVLLPRGGWHFSSA